MTTNSLARGSIAFVLGLAAGCGGLSPCSRAGGYQGGSAPGAHVTITPAGVEQQADMLVGVDGSDDVQYASSALRLMVRSRNSDATAWVAAELWCNGASELRQPGQYDFATVCPGFDARVDGAFGDDYYSETPARAGSATGTLTVTVADGHLAFLGALPGDTGHWEATLDLDAEMTAPDGTPVRLRALAAPLTADVKWEQVNCVPLPEK
jgi:hypothetical protein